MKSGPPAFTSCFPLVPAIVTVPYKEHSTSLLDTQLAQPLLPAAKASNPFTLGISVIYPVDVGPAATELSTEGTVVQVLSEFLFGRNKR